LGEGGSYCSIDEKEYGMVKKVVFLVVGEGIE